MTMPATGAWERARRILCVRLDAMGDLVMTGPAMRALKEQFPERHLSLLTSPAGAAAARMMPWIDEVISYRAPWMKSTPAGIAPQNDLEMARRLEAGNYDAGVIFTVYSQSPLPAALLLHLAGIPLKLAYCRENAYHLLSDWVQEIEPEKRVRHEVQRHIDLVARVGAQPADDRLCVQPPESAREHVERLLGRLGLRDRRDWLVIHPGASAPSRRYPPEHFAQVVSDLVLRKRLIPVLTGSGGERGLIDEILRMSGVGAINLCDLLDLQQLTALLERAPLLLANNTGPVHLAAGVGTPVVDLYALTNPQHTPWKVRSKVLYHDVPCRFCYRSVCPEGHQACLRKVEPGRVVRAVVELLEESVEAPETEAVTETEAASTGGP